ncbi:class I SAM-dependent methyltransferase [Streptomyces fulvoviolaceus]|uniref:class I SAM-dependent methyltransferase n=1 Tax=Streptomyces fulvoviolaceus TaxID=285535 RepID=UPI0004CC28E0|nr:class I SAM-dependent methyltransferase [Streptomyces fulvoviolaceus]MCT9076873.1 class I SAM-dependent methyltransferase [Streptomyces fulvoviolaceus]
MPMNRAHRRICSSEDWAQKTKDFLLPWALEDVDLGRDVLEIGPGYGANLRVLVDLVPRLTAAEIDADTVRLLQERWGERAHIVLADGADLPLPSASYDSVVCFTMLHHVPTAAHQDRIFAEAFRVLRPGGTFAGSDSQPSLRFRLLHLRDTMNTLDPATLPARLKEAGFTDVAVDLHPESGGLRFRGRRP